MTNFDDLSVQLKDAAAFQIFWHVTHGIYIWEYVTTLDFEWDVIRGRRSYRWTIWIYSLARAALLMTLILNLVEFDVTTPLNCDALIVTQIALAYASLVGASLLIILRIIAIWKRNKFAVAIVVTTWVINVSVIIQGLARLRATWNTTFLTCVIVNSEALKPTLVVTPITDTILLVAMFVGLFPLLSDGGYAFGLGRLLWRQGIIWLLIATIAGALPTVFIFLNLNVQFNLMFHLPSVMTNVIAATRIYRSLADYAFGSLNVNSVAAGSSKSDTRVSKIRLDNPPIEVAVDTVYEHYPTSRKMSGVDVQRHDEPHELGVGGPIETGFAK